MARQILAGTIDVDIEVKVIDATTGVPITTAVSGAAVSLWYRRNGSALVNITDVSLAALTTAHTDGGFLHISDGMYRVDLPDAACAVGANHVVIGGAVTGGVVIGELIELVAYNPYDAVRMGLTALPNANAEAAGGLYTRGTGAGQINQPANGRVDTNVVAMATDTLTNTALAASAVTEIQTGLASQSSVDAIGTAVDTEVAAIKAKTDQLVFTTTNRVDSTVVDKTGFALTTGERDAIAAALLDLANGVETGKTMRQSLRAMASILAGDVTGAGTATEVFKALGNAGTTRVTVPVDASGNRTGVTVS